MANVGTNDLTNATAIGANAFVGQSDTLVLGSIAGVNGATASTKVGIRTDSPTAKLTVSGSGAFNAAGAPGFDLFNTTAGTGFLQHVTDSGLWQIATTDGVTILVIDPVGNVGIGTTSPDQKLTVNGDASKPGGGSWAVYSDE